MFVLIYISSDLKQVGSFDLKSANYFYVFKMTRPNTASCSNLSSFRWTHLCSVKENTKGLYSSLLVSRLFSDQLSISGKSHPTNFSKNAHLQYFESMRIATEYEIKQLIRSEEHTHITFCSQKLRFYRVFPTYDTRTADNTGILSQSSY